MTMPDPLLYGLWRDETLVVLDASWAHRADNELTRLEAITSWDDLVAACNSLTALDPPVDTALGPVEWGIDPAEPLTLDDLPVVADGDFPPMPGALTKRFLPAEMLDGSEILWSSQETVFNGDYLVIAPDQETPLVAALESRGFALERDDSLMAHLAREK